MPEVHASPSASSSHRWLNCPPSAKLNAGVRDTPSEYARQGTDCHELCAYLVEKELGRKVKDPQKIWNITMRKCRIVQKNTEITY